MDQQNQQIVLGLDGSPGSEAALAWAIGLGGALGRIQPVIAWHYPWWSVSVPALGSPMPPSAEHLDQQARRLVDSMVADLDEALYLEPVVARSVASAAILEVASDGSIIAVGTHGRGGALRGLLGSVSHQVVNRATVPVAVVPQEAATIGLDSFVVGIDGSAQADEAAAWAIRHANAGADIHLVNAWTFEALGVPELEESVLARLEVQAQEVVGATLHRLRDMVDEAAFERVKVRSSTPRGDTREVLRSAAGDESILVVGARGRGGLAHTFLGSVATSLVHRPETVTIVVHSSKR